MTDSTVISRESGVRGKERRRYSEQGRRRAKRTAGGESKDGKSVRGRLAPLVLDEFGKKKSPSLAWSG